MAELSSVEFTSIVHNFVGTIGKGLFSKGDHLTNERVAQFEGDITTISNSNGPRSRCVQIAEG
jgi:hypothetical protein